MAAIEAADFHIRFLHDADFHYYFRLITGCHFTLSSSQMPLLIDTIFFDGCRHADAASATLLLLPESR